MNSSQGKLQMLLSALSTYRQPLLPADSALLSVAVADEVERMLAHRPDHAPTPLHALPGLARTLGVASIHVKDEGQRLGLGSFKALGGSYAVIRLVLEAASERLGRPVDVSELSDPTVRAIAADMTVACATDGNHGRSVAYGARLVGAKAVIFVHDRVSVGRVAAIAGFGAEVVRVSGTYDDSVAEASQVADRNGWVTVSDTAWPGYERIPGLVMQGYTPLLREALRQMSEPPTHVFLQAGVGGMAAAVAGHLSVLFGEGRPAVVVVEPKRAACLYDSVRAGRPIRITPGEPTVMSMLECYEPSLLAWRILSRVADAFMTLEEDDAIGVMKRLARPIAGDPVVTAGESGGVGLAGLLAVAADDETRVQLRLEADSRVFVINTEGATDPQRYRQLTGVEPIDGGVVR